jgi:hypothetical protein
MDEYLVVPKRLMETKSSSQTAQLQVNKEPPEALEVLSLDNLVNRMLKRTDISQWEKAGQITATLERFLALKPRALPESGNPVPTDVHPQTSTKEWTPEPSPKNLHPQKKAAKPRFQTPRRAPTLPTAATEPKRSGRLAEKKKKTQGGTGKKAFKFNAKWIFLK